MTIREAVDAGVLVWRDSKVHLRVPMQYLQVNEAVLATTQTDCLSGDWYSTVYMRGERVWGSPLYQTKTAACSAAENWLDEIGIGVDAKTV